MQTNNKFLCNLIKEVNSQVWQIEKQGGKLQVPLTALLIKGSNLPGHFYICMKL